MVKKLNSLVPSFLPFINHCGRAILQLLYPPICIHCGRGIEEKSAVFCRDCREQCVLIDPLERCPYCFSEEYYRERQRCPECLSRAPVLHRIAAAWDYVGPPVTLIRKLKQENQPYLAKGAAAIMVVQLAHLNWPIPDVIIPVPLPLNKWMHRGYNQSLLIAQHIGKLLSRPVHNVLRRVSGDYSQTGLARLQRMRLTPRSLQLVKKVNLEDKCLLLIDDVMITGSTLRCCGEILYAVSPANIYGLTLCRAMP